MGKSVSITVHPSALGAEYLTVSDAMRQVLDLVEALERSESVVESSRQIVWRLTEAHTNSPPFTVTAEAYPVDPCILIDIEAMRVSERFAVGLQELLNGHSGEWIDKETASPLKRAFQRNQNGVGRTEIVVGGEPLNVTPANAKNAVIALERLELDWQDRSVDQRRTEFGSVEAEVCGITRWYDKPALIMIERLSRDKVTCVLSAELAGRLGPTHRWAEAWEGERLLISGALHFGPDGSLIRIEAANAEQMPWTDIELADLHGIDILDGRSVREHLELIRGSDFG